MPQPLATSNLRLQNKRNLNLTGPNRVAPDFRNPDLVISFENSIMKVQTRGLKTLKIPVGPDNEVLRFFFVNFSSRVSERVPDFLSGCVT